MTPTHSIWQAPPVIAETANEAKVEHDFIVPILAALGYDNEHIAPKHPVIFQAGRSGRPNEADFAVFDSNARELLNCLMVVEAKRPKESFTDAQVQAESYAMYLRALVYLVTDGLSLEIWQFNMGRRSELAFKCEVKDLLANQAKIEALLRRENLLNYRARFREPSMPDVAWDISSYLDAELKRVSNRPASVSRTLSLTANNTDPLSQSLADECLTCDEQGRVITACSGMGKTSLASRLHTRSLLAAENSDAALVPIEISLPDLAESSKTLVEFSLDRLVAHCNGFTHSMFIQILQGRGVAFFCDSFDRVSDSARSLLEANIKLTLRDYPRCRLFVFTRPSSIPRVGLPVFHLQPLHIDEQRELQQAIALGQRSIQKHIPDIVSILPPFLARIANSALIFSKIVEFYLRNRKLPTNLKEIFESWLEALIPRADHKLTIYSALKDGLTTVALQTWCEPASIAKLMQAFTAQGLSLDVLDQLQQLGALQLSTNVELEHEAIADFLRAKYVAEEMRTSGFSEAYVQYLQPDSFFPVLLSALITSAEKQSELFRALSPLGLRGYLEAVHYRAPTVSNAASLDKNELTKHVMAEITDGFYGPARAFFPHLLPRLIAIETGTYAESISTEGEIDESRTWVNFYFVPMPDSQTAQRERRQRGRSDSDVFNNARVIGIEVLQEALDNVIASACIDGGIVWSEERVLTRLRGLIFDGLEVPGTLNVVEQLKYWSGHLGKKIAVRSGTTMYLTPTDEIYEDLQRLERAGRRHLTVWWNSGAEGNWWDKGWDGSDGAIEQYYLRRDAAYGEIIRNNFQSFGFDFKEFEAVPRSWRIYLRQEGPFGNRLSLEELWDPVRSASQATVTVFRSVPERTSHTYYDDWFRETARKLAEFGRSTRSVSFSKGLAPPFDGYSLQGVSDGKTAVLRDVCQNLRRDFVNIFRSFVRRADGVPPFE
ncbi:type I restriction enzyme HsdR N-terminal domain-containing protein [Burkholderia ambifaria]